MTPPQPPTAPFPMPSNAVDFSANAASLPLFHPGMKLPFAHVPARMAEPPMTPQQAPFTPPWANHHPFSHARLPPIPTSPSTPTNSRRFSIAHSATSTPGFDSRRSSISHRGTGNPFRTPKHLRQRTWSVTLDQTPDGLKATGLIATDGSNMFIPHGTFRDPFSMCGSFH